MKKRTEIPIHTEWIKLDSLLKFSGFAETGGQAGEIIREGRIQVDGEVCSMRGKKIRPGQTVSSDDWEIVVTQWK